MIEEFVKQKRENDVGALAIGVAALIAAAAFTSNTGHGSSKDKYSANYNNSYQ